MMHLQVDVLPPWLRDYMAGASQELYKLHSFPAALVGQTVRDVTGFLFDTYHAVLLAVEGIQARKQRQRVLVAGLDQVCVLGVSLLSIASSVPVLVVL